MSGYTKGPWRTSNKKPLHVCDERGYKVADCPTTTKGGNFDIALDMSIANATLIAAAPELLEALEKALDLVDRMYEIGGVDTPYMDGTTENVPFSKSFDIEVDTIAARALIAKAKGESQ